MIMNRNRRQPLPRFLAGFFIVAVLPSILLVLVWQKIYADRAGYLHNLRRVAIQKDLSAMRRECDNAFYIERKLNHCYGLLAEEPVAADNIGRHLQALKQQGLNFVNFRFFDSSRRLIPVKGESETLRALIQKLFEALSQFETEGDNALLTRYRPLFESFLGSINPGALAGERSSLVRVLIKGQPAYFYWNMFFSPSGDGKFMGGMVAWFAESEIPENLAISQLVDFYNRDLESPKRYGMLNLQTPEKSYPAVLSDVVFAGGVTELAHETIMMRRNFLSELITGAQSLNILHIDADRILYFLEETDARAVYAASLPVRLLLIVFLPVVFFMALGGHNSGKGWQQIVAGNPGSFFLIGALFPVALLTVVGWSYIGLQRQILHQQSWERLAGHIENLDENYIVAAGNLEKLYRRFATSGAMRSGDLHGIRQSFALLKKADALQRFYLIDRDGKILLALPDRGAAAEMFGRLMTSVARKLFLAKFGGEQSWKDKVNSVMFESFSSGLSDLLGDAAANLFKPFENFGRLSEITFADRRNYVFSHFVETTDAADTKLMVIWHGAETFAERYLARQIMRNSSSSEQAQPVRLAMVPLKSGRMPYPREFGKYPFVGKLAERASASGAQQFSLEQVGGQEWLVAAVPMRQIADCLVYAMLPVHRVEAELHRLTALLVAAVFSCLLLSWWLGCRLFKSPI